MILEGFEIENWSCIRRLAVHNLPANGVVVLHGPNGTGKSSIIAALRACLMDFPATSNSKELKRWFPKVGSLRPRVSVTFRAQGASWRITKVYGTKDSRLEKRSALGTWDLQVASASDAHDQTCALTGGTDSSAGLHQLLWLTQAEFHLPEPKEFDADVQSQLRGVLGVLQTPLDDRFLQRIKKEWSRWFTARDKPGQNPKLKRDCPLDKALSALEQHRTELANIEAEFRNYEKLSERSADLETLALELRRQISEKTGVRDHLQQDYERSLKRLEAHRLAAERVAVAEKSLVDLQNTQRERTAAEQRVLEAQQAAQHASQVAEERTRSLDAAEKKLRELRREVQQLRKLGRECQAKRDVANARLQQFALREKCQATRDKLQRAEQAHAELTQLREQANVQPAPDQATLRKLSDNRAQAARMRADLQAAAIALTIVPDAGAAAPQVMLDGESSPLPVKGAIEKAVRQRAEIIIPGWGRITLMRGSDARGLAPMQSALGELDRAFADALTSFGIATDADDALDRLRSLASEKLAREPEIRRKNDEISRLAPYGLGRLRQEAAQLEKQLGTVDTRGTDANSDELKLGADQLKTEFIANEMNIRVADQQIEAIESEIDGGDNGAQGLRQQAAAARMQSANTEAALKLLRATLERMQTPGQFDAALTTAQTVVAHTKAELQSVQLSTDEQTIRSRLDAAKGEIAGLEAKLDDVEKEFNQIKGVLSHTEGLHQKRAAAAARVDWLTRKTEREMLESQAVDRLYALFEDCRDKQLGAVMGPIHDRVLNWMNSLQITGYESLHFNDQFLPEKLIARNGTAEFTFDEESIGTIEQMALMVRLALGATLSKPNEPVVTVLDDPLTHSDAARLERMRAVLRSAAAGDSASKPSAGPLQILVFTCHPAWFQMEDATVIDLGNPDVLRRVS